MPKMTEFQYLLGNAIGLRNNHKFAKEAGIDPSYFNKLYRNEDMKYPSPEILKKIAIIAENDVSYEDLMIACEYLPKKDMSEFKYKELLETLRKYIGTKGKIIYNGRGIQSWNQGILKDILYIEKRETIVFIFKDSESSHGTKFENIIFLEEKDAICCGKRDEHLIIYFNVIDKEQIN